MSILDDENILIEQAKLSIKDSIITFLQLNHLNELVEYLNDVMPVKDYQWKLINHAYTGDNMVVLTDGIILVCHFRLILDTKEPILFFNHLFKYKRDKIKILNKLDIEYSDFDYFLL